MHGHTYQGHAVACAAALEIQRILQEDNLVENCRKMGQLLGRLLRKELGKHPYVGDVRGRGLFWGVEFVRNKKTKRPFPPSDGVAGGICEMGLKEPYCIQVYPGTGTFDGVSGDHIIIAPAYNVATSDVEWMANKIGCLVTHYFAAKASASEGDY